MKIEMTVLKTICIFTFGFLLKGNFSWGADQECLDVKMSGKHLSICVQVPDSIKLVEIRIHSDRNQNISSFTEISPYNPNPEALQQLYGQYDRDICYPVVDVVLERGMEGIGTFENAGEGSYILNGPFYHEKEPMASTVVFPAGKLQEWENSVFVEPSSVRMTGFYLSLKCPVIAGHIVKDIELLTPQWSGEISLYSIGKGSDGLIANLRIPPVKIKTATYQKGESLQAERLITALKASVDFTLRSQIRDSEHPANGGLFLFYDLDASLYRSYHWIWGWGPSVSMLLRTANELPEDFDRLRLQQVADEIGRASLRFVWKDLHSPVNHMMISRWDRDLKWPDGYAGAVTAADALFLAGWAWVPLFELTGNKEYLEATRWQCHVTDSLLQHWTIPPHSYYFDKNGWSNWVIDETGFGVEGYAGLYKLAPNEQIRKSGKLFIDRHCEIFEREDGLWNRNYYFDSNKVMPTQHMTRGLAWAFEGLLAAHRLLPEEDYLERAVKMVDHLLRYQLPDGAWSFKYDQPVELVGYSEKGTAIWSYFLYELYSYTKDEKYLDAARKALVWCLNSLYDGPDVEANGSIVGLSEQSGVGYRRWFNVSCTYTSAFLGLAILEELKLENTSK